jgi:hypothetical protein
VGEESREQRSGKRRRGEGMQTSRISFKATSLAREVHISRSLLQNTKNQKECLIFCRNRDFAKFFAEIIKKYFGAKRDE